MTDLPTIIAEVYRACGWHEDEDGDFHHNDAGECVLVEDVGLDAFVRDIVPVLNARGIAVQWFQCRIDDWGALMPGSNSGQTHHAPTPVEACFRAAWEALKEGSDD